MLTFNFSKANKSNPVVTFPSLGLPVVLQPQTAFTSGTVSVPTHAPVPLPIGCLNATDVLGLYENNVRIPAQVEVVETWDVSGMPRWLHVHFVGKYDNGTARTYVLKKMTLPDTPPSTSLNVTQDSTTITVQNGFIKFVVSKTAYAGIQEMWYDSTGDGSYGSPILNTTLGGPTYTDQYGGVWRPQYNTPTYLARGGLGSNGAVVDIVPHVSVTVEDTGSTKVTIVAKGYYQPPASFQPQDTGYTAANLCPLVVMGFTNRITLYADLPWVLFQHANTPTAYWKTQNWTTINGPVSDPVDWNYPIATATYCLPITGATGYNIGIDGGTINGDLAARTTSLTDNLVAFWKMSDGNDSVYQNNLIVSGATTFGPGLNGNGAVLDGSSGTGLYIPHNAGIDIGGRSFAISGWVKFSSFSYTDLRGQIVSKFSYQPGVYQPNNPNPEQTFLLHYDQSANAIQFYINTDTTWSPSLDSPTGISFTTTDLGGAWTTGVWYHITAQWSADTGMMDLVINGIKKSQPLAGVPANSPQSYLVFGFGFVAGLGFYHFALKGTLDSWGLWNGRILTDAEIATLRNSGAGFEYPFGLTLSPTRYADANAAYLHQYRHNKVRLLGDALPQDTNVLEKSDGWVEATSPSMHTLLVSKNAWQQFPKEFEISSNGISYHQWPQHSFSTFSTQELIDPKAIPKFWYFCHGDYWDAQCPVEYVTAMQVGPQRICTFATGDAAHSIVTTTTPHIWSSGQTVWFIRANPAAVLPTTTPQIAENEFLFNQVEQSSRYYNNSVGNISAISSGSGGVIRITVDAGGQFWGSGVLLRFTGFTGTNASALNSNIYSAIRVDSTHLDVLGTIYNAGTGVSSATGTPQPYYIQVINNTSFKVFTDSGLTNQVLFSAAGSGTLLVGSFTNANFNDAGDVLQENYPPAVLATTPSGVSFHNEFALIFSQSGVNNAGYQALYQQHPIAMPSADWCASSGCLGPLAAQAADFPDIEAALKKAITSYCNHVRTENYGQYNYGDSHHTWYSDEDRASLWRLPMNSHYFICETLWTMFFRSGDTDLLNLARIYGDHYVSVDTMRIFGFGTTSTPSTGCVFDHCKGLLHWGDGAAAWSQHFGDSDSLLLGWLIDANPWHKQAFDDFMAATYTQAYQDIGTLPAQMLSDYDTVTVLNFRDSVGPLKRLLVTYEHTHDTRLLPAIYILGTAAASRPLSGPKEVGPLWHPRWPTKYLEVIRDPNYSSFIEAAAVDFNPVGGSIAPIDAKVVELGLLDATTYLTPTLMQLTNYNNIIANIPDDPYDGFGVGPGPEGDDYLWLCWPYLLKQLRAHNITTVDPTTAADYYGSYFIPNDISSIYIYKNTSSNWTFNMANYTLGGDIHAQTVVVNGPVTSLAGSGTQRFVIGDGVNAVYQAQLFTGYSFNAAIDTSTGIITTSGGQANTGINTWTTGQFVCFEPEMFPLTKTDSDVVLPVASVPITLHNPNYYIRSLSSTTLRLYPTANDAIADTNRISFSTTGSFLALTTRGNFPYVGVFIGGVLGTFTVAGDNSGPGVYRITTTGGAPVNVPFTSFPECQLVQAGTYSVRRLIGYLDPLVVEPITITVSVLNNTGALNVLIKDANNTTIISESVVKRLDGSSTMSVIMNNADGHPTPWSISIIGSATGRVSFSGTPGTDLFLYGPNGSGIQTIKTALGLPALIRFAERVTLTSTGTVV